MGPVVVVFLSPECFACALFKPDARRIAERFAGQVTTKWVDVNDPFSDAVGVRGSPSAVAFNSEGFVVGKIEGGDEKGLTRLYEKLIG